MTIEDVLKEFEFQHKDNLSSLDGAVVDGISEGDLAQLNALLPLDNFLLSDPDLQWERVLPYFRTVSSTYNGQLIGVPLGVSLFIVLRSHHD